MSPHRSCVSVRSKTTSRGELQVLQVCGKIRIPCSVSKNVLKVRGPISTPRRRDVTCTERSRAGLGGEGYGRFASAFGVASSRAQTCGYPVLYFLMLVLIFASGFASTSSFPGAHAHTHIQRACHMFWHRRCISDATFSAQTIQLV